MLSSVLIAVLPCVAAAPLGHYYDSVFYPYEPEGTTPAFPTGTGGSFPSGTAFSTGTAFTTGVIHPTGTGCTTEPWIPFSTDGVPDHDLSARDLKIDYNLAQRSAQSPPAYPTETVAPFPTTSFPGLGFPTTWPFSSSASGSPTGMPTLATESVATFPTGIPTRATESVPMFPTENPTRATESVPMFPTAPFPTEIPTIADSVAPWPTTSFPGLGFPTESVAPFPTTSFPGFGFPTTWPFPSSASKQPTAYHANDGLMPPFPTGTLPAIPTGKPTTWPGQTVYPIPSDWPSPPFPMGWSSIPPQLTPTPQPTPTTTR